MDSSRRSGSRATHAASEVGSISGSTRLPSDRIQGASGPATHAPSATSARAPPAMPAPRCGHHVAASHSPKAYSAAPNPASSSVTAPIRSATRKSNTACTTVAHANDAGTSSVSSTTARSPGSGTEGAVFRIRMKAASGPAPSSVPANATRSRRRASPEPARANGAANSTNATRTPAANHSAAAVCSAASSGPSGTSTWCPIRTTSEAANSAVPTT